MINMIDWKQIASQYKTQHEKDTGLIACLAAQLIRFKTGKCNCVNRPGDEYYCPTHGGEGCWIDLKVKSDMLIEKLGDWIINQSDDAKRSAAAAFGVELKALGQTLQKIEDCPQWTKE